MSWYVRREGGSMVLSLGADQANLELVGKLQDRLCHEQPWKCNFTWWNRRAPMEVTFSARVSAACTHAPRLFCPASALFLPDGSMAKNLPVTQETQESWVQSPGQEDPLEEEMATHSSILAWRIPWTEKPSRLQSAGSQTEHACTHIPLATFTAFDNQCGSGTCIHLSHDLCDKLHSESCT